MNDNFISSLGNTDDLFCNFLDSINFLPLIRKKKKNKKKEDPMNPQMRERWMDTAQDLIR